LLPIFGEGVHGAETQGYLFNAHKPRKDSLMNMNTPTTLSSPVTTTTSIPNAPTADTAPDPANAILAVMQGYGYSENEGIARRQQRALALLLQGHYVAKDLTLNADGLPVVTRFQVRSGTGTGHYHVTKIPNALGWDCTCPDSWAPCKHRYGAALLQAGLRLTHTHRADLATYCSLLRDLPQTTPCGSHELAALKVLLNTTEIYDSLAQEAARQYYGANRTYASTCFSAMLDKARWAYGAGYVGWMDGDIGELHSVLAGRPVIAVRWHPVKVRWYVASANGEEDRAATLALLAATRPSWESPLVTADSDPMVPADCFEEEPDGHYTLPS
jgi:hypothetical protein